MNTISLYTDGGARWNPWSAGCGWVLYDEWNTEVHSGYAPLGIMTNNQAEYEWLVRWLKDCILKWYTQVHVHMDSELIIKQLQGVYKVKNPQMRIYFWEVCDLVSALTVSYTHVRREMNTRADELSNMAMDENVRS